MLIGIESVLALILASMAMGAVTFTAYLTWNDRTVLPSPSATSINEPSASMEFVIYDESDFVYDDDKRSCCPFHKQLTSWEWVLPLSNHERHE